MGFMVLSTVVGKFHLEVASQEYRLEFVLSVDDVVRNCVHDMRD